MRLSGKDLWRYLLSNGVNATTYMAVWRFNVSHQNGIYLVPHPSQPAPAERYRELCWKLRMLAGLILELTHCWCLCSSFEASHLRNELQYTWPHLCLFVVVFFVFFFNIVEISMEGASKVALDTRASYIFWEQDNYLPKQLSSLWRRSGQGYFLSWPQMVTFTW